MKTFTKIIIYIKKIILKSWAIYLTAKNLLYPCGRAWLKISKPISLIISIFRFWKIR